MTGDVSLAGQFEMAECPACPGAPSRVWLDTGDGTRYVRCVSCGTIYASPRASRASRYAWLDEQFSLGENAFQNAQARKSALTRIAGILKTYVSRGALLDIGCDLGYLFEYFQGDAWRRFGVELSPSAAEYASKTFGASVHAGYIAEAQFPDSFFDVVTMLDMFYHLENPRGDLDAVARVVKAGGYLAIEVSGLSYYLLRSIGLVSLLIDRKWTRLHSNSVYLFYFTPRGLRKLVETCGFEVVSAHVINSPFSVNPLRNTISVAYGSLIRFLLRFSPYWLNWAPKYLLVARRKKT
ncbi:MAG: hypothetical protein Kow0070_12810 [Anaerolineales bacterium]